MMAGGVHGRKECMVGSMRGSGVHGSRGVCDRGHTSWGRVWSRSCIAGGMHGRGRGHA